MQTLEEAGGVDGFVSPASFWFPEALPESAWHQHAPFAFWLMQVLRPRSFVELGTHHGFSYLCLCQAAERLQLGARGYAVDTWQGDDHAGFYDGEVYARLRDLHDPRYGSFSRLVRSTFDEALPHFAEKSIDLLHIDGRHFYDDVKHDFESWQGKLSDRAVVLFHDTNVREHGFGVFRFWAELCERYPAFEFLHGHGLGVLGVGRDLPAMIDALLRASSDASLTRQVREVYARLGAAIEDRHTAARQEEKIGDLGRELTAARQEAEEQLAAADVRSKNLELRITEDATRLAQLSDELKQLQQAKDDADRHSTTQSERIGELEQELLNSTAQLTGSERQIGLMAAKLNDLEKKSNSSRWLLKAIGRKLIHAPRDFSRRTRGSWRKRRSLNEVYPIGARDEKFSLTRLRDARYRKYHSSRLVLGLQPLIPSFLVARMQRRMAKNKYFEALPVVSNSTEVDPLSFFRVRSLEEEVREWCRVSPIPRLINDEEIARLLAEKTKKNEQQNLIIAISHDDFTDNVGGIQLCMHIEREHVINSGGIYFALHPLQSLPRLAHIEEDPNPVLGIILDGTLIGFARIASIQSALKIILESSPALDANLVIHSLLGHVPEFIAEIADTVSIPHAYFWLHDYSAICPGYNLLRNRRHYCGAPPPQSAACGICVFGEERRTHLERVNSLFDAIDFTVISPSETAQHIWKQGGTPRYRQAVTLPHCHLGRPLPGSPPTYSDDLIRIAFIGGRSAHKGWDTFRRLFEHLSEWSGFEFHHFATAKGSESGFKFHRIQSSHSDPQAVSRGLASAQIDIIIQWSISPETFSFTSHEALAAGAFIVTNHKSGNVAALVRKTGCGVVLESEADLIQFFETGQAALQVREHRKSREGLLEIKYSRMSAELIFRDESFNERSLLHELLI